MYDANPVYPVIVSVAMQMFAIVLYMICIRRSEREKGNIIAGRNSKC